MSNVQWKTPDDGQRNCPEHVDFLDKNKFGKMSASVGFIKKKCICSTCKRHEYNKVIRTMNIRIHDLKGSDEYVAKRVTVNLIIRDGN